MKIRPGKLAVPEAGRLGAVVVAALLSANCFHLPGALAAKNKPVQVSAQEMSLAETLKSREKALLEKEEELNRREKELAALKKDVDEKLDRLLALQKGLKETLAELKSVKDKRFKNLIKVYSAMSASKVAPLVNDMEDDDAVEILRALKAEQVAKIIPKIDREKAIRLSRMLGLAQD